MLKGFLTCVLVVLSVLNSAPVFAFDTSQGDLTVTKMMDGLDEPWSFGFLPDGSVLITERRGVLWWVKDGKRYQIPGVPRVAAKGQGGLLDIMIPRDFATSRELFFTYAKRQDTGAGTVLAVARLSDNNQRLPGLDRPVRTYPGFIRRAAFWQPHRRGAGQQAVRDHR